MVQTAKARGLRGLAVTDHNSLGGSRRALELASGPDLIVVRGMEISSRDGHILAYGVEEEVPRGLDAMDTLRAIEALGGLAVAAHPGRFWSGLKEEDVRASPFQAIEALNARSVARHNRRATALGQELGLPVTGGSDAHRLADLGRAVVTIPEGAATEEEVLEALRKGEGQLAGSSRTSGRTFRYVAKSVSEWVVRGFRKI